MKNKGIGSKQMVQANNLSAFLEFFPPSSLSWFFFRFRKNMQRATAHTPKTPVSVAADDWKSQEGEGK